MTRPAPFGEGCTEMTASRVLKGAAFVAFVFLIALLQRRPYNPVMRFIVEEFNK